MTPDPAPDPRRGLLYIQPCRDPVCPVCPGEDGRRALIAGCDCAATTHLMIQGGIPEGSEVAFTCQCGTVHWITLRWRVTR
jgi:hypothetical protein